MGHLACVLGRLRGVLEACWTRLGASWGHLRRVLGKMSKKARADHLLKGFLGAKMEAKIVETHVQKAICFLWRFVINITVDRLLLNGMSSFFQFFCDFSCF